MAFHGCPAIQVLAEELGESGSVEVRGGQALVCVAGEGLMQAPGIVGDVFGHLADIRVSMVAQGGSEVALTFVVEEADLPRTVRMLHDRFFGAPPSAALSFDAEPCGPPALL